MLGRERSTSRSLWKNDIGVIFGSKNENNKEIPEISFLPDAQQLRSSKSPFIGHLTVF